MANGWYSAQELAGLPGMPGTERGVRKALQKNLPVTRSKERGKGLEYPITCLPRETQDALQQREIAAQLPAIVREVAAPVIIQAPAHTLTDAQRLERDARKGVRMAIRQLMEEARCSQEAALHTILATARAGSAEPATIRLLQLARDKRGRAGDGFPSIRTLKRWLAADDLTPRQHQKDMRVPAWASAFLAIWQQPQKPTVELAYREFCQSASATGRPSIHQVRRFLGKLGAVTRETGRMGPRELKTIRPFIRREFMSLAPNEVWSADGHTFDAEVQHPFHGRPFRPEITSIVDIATRRIVGISVALAESAHAVLDALRHAVENAGKPAIFYVDRGSGYDNALIKDEGLGLRAALGFAVVHSLPYNSQARGVIERLHQTVWVRESGLSAEDRQALDLQRAQGAQSEGSYAAARAGVALLEGRGKDFDKYAKAAEKFLERAMKFAESAQDANLVEDIGKQQAALDEARARAEDKKAADAEAQSAALMDQLNAVQAKLKDLKGEAATIQVNAEIAGAINQLAEVEKKLAALQDKTVTVTVNTIQAGAPTAVTPPADAGPLPTFAFGGQLPGSASHDRADNMLYWGTPGEWVIQRPAARYYGSAFMAALNAMKLPKFATGGQLGASAIGRLAIPSLPSGAGATAGNNLTLDFGELGKFRASASQDTQRELERVFARAALAYGRK